MPCTCSMCSQNIRENAPSIQCTKCRMWIHAKCTNMSKSEFTDTAKKIMKKELLWACESCKKEVSVIFSDNEQEEDDEEDSVPTGKIEQLFEKHYKRITTCFEAKFNKFKEEIANNVADIRKEVNDMKKEVSKVSKHNTKLTSEYSLLDKKLTDVEGKINQLSTPTENIITEMNERRRRESNVIALNVKESNKKDGKDRLVDDRNQLSAALPPEIIPNLSNYRIRRLGRPVAGRTRPMLITTPNAAEAMTILKTKSEHAMDGESGIIFKSDLTPAQTSYLKELREELNALHEKGEKDKTIRYINGIPRIVKSNDNTNINKRKNNFRQPSQWKASDLPTIVLPEC